jgi:hypothetical protein
MTQDQKREFLVKTFWRMMLSGSVTCTEFTHVIREIEEGTSVTIDEMYNEWNSI